MQQIAIKGDRVEYDCSGGLFQSKIQNLRLIFSPPPGKMVLSGRALVAALLCIAFVIQLGQSFAPFLVGYDHRALLIDGKRRMLISAGIHYPRATPEVLTHSSASGLLAFLWLLGKKFLGFIVCPLFD